MNLTTRYKVSDDEAAYIGINMADVSADVSQNYGIPTGVCIMSVVDGSPAADAGFKKGDVITTFDGRSISIPAIGANNFELKPQLVALMQQNCKFYGLPSEDPF